MRTITAVLLRTFESYSLWFAVSCTNSCTFLRVQPKPHSFLPCLLFTLTQNQISDRNVCRCVFNQYSSITPQQVWLSHQMSPHSNWISTWKKETPHLLPLTLPNSRRSIHMSRGSYFSINSYCRFPPKLQPPKLELFISGIKQSSFSAPANASLLSTASSGTEMGPVMKDMLTLLHEHQSALLSRPLCAS